MKRAIIIGATSGIGKEVAKGLLLQGWKIGVAGRRKTALDAFRTIAPDNIEVETLDVTQEDATERLHSLINKLFVRARGRGRAGGGPGGRAAGGGRRRRSRRNRREDGLPCGP